MTANKDSIYISEITTKLCIALYEIDSVDILKRKLNKVSIEITTNNKSRLVNIEFRAGDAYKNQDCFGYAKIVEKGMLLVQKEITNNNRANMHKRIVRLLGLKIQKNNKLG